MSKDKNPDMEIAISERAREYRVRQYNERIVRAKSYFDSIDVELAFKSGATMFSTENAKLREALREVISRYEILERSVMVHPDYVFGDDNDEWHTFIDCGKEPLNEAKQLLTDNTQDNENN